MQDTEIVKARATKRGEVIFHAPKGASGKYYLTVNQKNGVIKYTPLGEVKIG